MGEPTSLALDAESRATERGIWEGLGKDAYDRLPIYDPVMHEEGSGEEYDAYMRPMSWRIPSHEHQVTQQANGTVEATFEIPESPNGDWQSLTGGGFMYSEEEWEDLPPIDPVEAWADTVNYNEKVYPYSAYDNTTFVQIGDNINVAAQKSTGKRWVELPDCDGSADEIPLEVDHSADAVENSLPRPNGTVATCKHRPDAPMTGEADAALDSMTPGF
jgi:hypothetical protein